MKKIFILTFITLIFQSCALKHTQELVHTGDYDNAISIAISSLTSNKDKKSKQEYVSILEEAFAKAKARDLNTINLLEKEANPAQLEKIYQTYLLLNNRQEKIKPLLPLNIYKEDRQANFSFENYNNQLVASKNALSDYLYNNTKILLKSNSKLNFRKAFDDLTYLNQINPNFKDVNELLKEAKFRGSDFVIVSAKNETNMVIPVRLQNDILDFNTYGLNDKWTVYHSAAQNGINYDFGLRIRFQEILVSPEQIKEKEFTKERRIKEGQKKLIDANGREVLNEKGNVVMVDNLKDVSIKINEFRQFKSCLVNAKIEYIDLTNNTLIQSFPLSSEFVFENVYAYFKGDRRAADDNYMANFDKKNIPFPTNEQIIYNTSQDLKNKLKGILNQNRFRN